MPTPTEARIAEMLRRSGKDPVVLDKRPLSVIMGDEIPEARWAQELKVVNRAGYRTWFELLQERQRLKGLSKR